MPAGIEYSKETSFWIRDVCFGMTYSKLELVIDDLSTLATSLGYSLT